MRKILLILSTMAVTLAMSSADAFSQYFGRNKVRYQDLEFTVLTTDHFDIYFYPQEREGAEIAARLAERWQARLQRIFDHELRGRQPLILYSSHPAFEQTNVIRGELGEGTGGVTEPVRRRIVLPLAGPLNETDHVIEDTLNRLHHLENHPSGVLDGVAAADPHVILEPAVRERGVDDTTTRLPSYVRINVARVWISSTVPSNPLGDDPVPNLERL